MFVAGAINSGIADRDATGLIRPLRLGVSIGHPAGSVGSLGGFVSPLQHPESICLLSSATVLWPQGAAIGHYVHQPGPLDNQLFTGETRVAQITKDSPLSRSQSQSVDAGYVRLLEGIEFTGNAVPNGLPSATKPLIAPNKSAPEVGDEVAKIGRSTGYTTGRISAVDIAFTVRSVERSRAWRNSSAEVFNAIEIDGGEEPFSGPGDSGAVIYRIRDGMALGLLFASSRTGNGQFRTFAHPLVKVLEALRVRWL